MRLSPLDPLMAAAEYGIAFAHFFAGRYEEASSWAEKAVRELRDHHGALRLLAASRALAGRLDGAQEVMSHLREIDPTLCISGVRDLMPLRRSSDVAKYVEGLREAGLPE